MTPFEITDPLPEVGVTVLEASAGTGKTYAVAALATRLVAEAVVGLDELLVITFSRAATRELRDRVREMFVRTAADLADPTADGDLVRVLRDGAADADELGLRRQRLLDAVANYDAATIATTHEFCNAVLRSLGVAGDSDSSESLREDITTMVDEVVDDLYLGRYADTTAAALKFRDAARVARSAIDNPHAEIRPASAAAGSEEAEQVEFARAARDQLEHRKRRSGVFTFDDMLSRLDSALTSAESPAALRMRTRWRAVLVDEFQDTDPVQWSVLRKAFSDQARLVLIGDPKQAIYGFRGGDTPTYLAAVADAEKRTLPANWRSDPAVVDGLQALLRGAALGDPRITVHPVRAARAESRLAAPHGGVRLRQVRREGFSLTKSGTVRLPAVREHIAADLAGQIASMLNDNVEFTDSDGTTRPLGPGDFAVLLHSVGRDGPQIRRQLAMRGIKSVVNSGESVMDTPAARHWLCLLQAMEKPQLPRRVRAAGLTPFFPSTPEELDAGGDDVTDDLAERIRNWLDLFRSRGIAAVHSAALVNQMSARVLSHDGGERLLTDLNHIAQLLHAAAQTEGLGITGLIGWLNDAIEEGRRNDSRRRRLEVDAEAVQFVTVHGAKGLQYPVVLLPQLFDRSARDWQTIHGYHEGDLRCLDVANTPQAREASRIEEAEEELRLAYVAMTRAQSELIVWWAPTYNAGLGPLTRLLFDRAPGQPEVSSRVRVPESDEGVDSVLAGWARHGAFRVEPSVVLTDTVPPVAAGREVAHRVFGVDFDPWWRRTSYSGLTRADEQLSHVGSSEPENPGKDDEDSAEELPSAEVSTTETPAAEVDPAGVDEALLSPMNPMAGGAVFGSLVHAVLEHADPSAPDLRAELLARIEEQRRWWSVPNSSEELADAMLPMQHTSLGPLADNLTLAQIGLSDRLRELDFEFPMASGDRPVDRTRLSGVPLAAFADAMRRHLRPDDPMLGYADRLAVGAMGEQMLRGYLSGSIDVVLRVGPAPDQRFVVVDYKTNTLGSPDRPATAWDYTPQQVAEAMTHSHYPLQAMLYSVVLHRFLRWRLPGYDPSRHLGGVLYLYVRGMIGPATPEIDGVPCGVFSWHPPADLVLELSRLLDGGRGGERR